MDSNLLCWISLENWYVYDMYFNSWMVTASNDIIQKNAQQPPDNREISSQQQPPATSIATPGPLIEPQQTTSMTDKFGKL